MSETTRRMLLRGVAAAKAGELEEARRYLKRVLHWDPPREHRSRAHLWLFRISEDPKERRGHLETILAGDPTHAEARRALAILDGRLDPDDVIDPDRDSETREAGAPQTASGRRFVCPRCGGQMGFEPDTQRLHCAYCDHRMAVLSAMRQPSGVEERDFIVAMATAKGHEVPQGVQTFRCQGCQAALMTSDSLTARCPYCGSSHVVEVESESQVEPEGVIPFAVEERAANRRFAAWLDAFGRTRPSRVAHVRGIYLPLWTFDLMGEVTWRAVEGSRHGGSLSATLTSSGFGQHSAGRLYGERRAREGIHSFMVNDVLVPASHLLPYALVGAFDDFELEEASPFDPAYLAGRPAVRYDIAVSDASLLARRRVLDRARRRARIEAEVRMGEVGHLQVIPSRMSVQSYKLLLVPVWLGNYRVDDETYAVAVNGQTGVVEGERPPGLFAKLFGW